MSGDARSRDQCRSVDAEAEAHSYRRRSRDQLEPMSMSLLRFSREYEEKFSTMAFVGRQLASFWLH